MASIGQQLTYPETGWKRYDITPSKTEFSIYGTWYFTSDDSNSYNSTRAWGKAICGYKFNFIGDKLRIIAGTYPTRSSSIKVYIDNTLQGTYSGVGSEKYQILLYEINSLIYKEHFVNIECDDKYADYDAIDINENGTLKSYNPNLKPNKYLIKQNNQYYSIKPEFYLNGQFQPLTLEGGTTPNENDYESFGFEYVNDLLIPQNKKTIQGTDMGVLREGKYFEVELGNEIKKVNNIE